jgi:hypothetical protein
MDEQPTLEGTEKLPDWLPAGDLDDHITVDQARRIINLARSGEQVHTNQLMLIGMTKGLRHARFALDAIASEREMLNAHLFRQLEIALILITAFAAIAALVSAAADIF